MSSHIHDLWDELELPEEYPELDPNVVLSRVNAALDQEKRSGKQPLKKKIRLVALLAAVLVLLSGTALAVAHSAGFLDLFFQGNTSQLEPYVQTVIDSAENEDYRLSVNSAFYDGQNIYAVITVEGLNDQAVEDLKSNRVIAESHRESWGDEMADHLLESNSTGPDTFCFDFTRILGGCGSRELSAPSETSRSWQISICFHEYIGVQEEPFEFWLGFMGRDYAVYFPMDIVIEPIRITPNEEVTVNTYNGWKGILKEFVLTPTSYSAVVERIGVWTDSTGGQLWTALSANDHFFLRMKDGSVLTREQLGVVNQQFGTVVDLNQVESVIYGYTEFPVDGSPSFPAELDEHLYPFYCTLLSPSKGLWQVSADDLCRGLGVDCTWDEATQTGFITYRDVTIVFPVGSSTVYVDEEAVELSYSILDEEGNSISHPGYVVLENGELFIPISLLSYWNLATSTLYLADGSPGAVVIIP